MEINIVNNNKAIVKYDNGTEIKIPSQMFPLNGELKLFTSNNTEVLTDSTIESIFNSVKPRMGKCYYNAQDLIDALIIGGIDSKRIKSYVGWLFVGDTIPVHHCFVMLDNKHVLDFGPLKQFENFDEYTDMDSIDRFKNDIIENDVLLNSQKMTFGRALSVIAYVVSECSPKEGEKIRAKLEKAYPKHISFL